MSYVVTVNWSPDGKRFFYTGGDGQVYIGAPVGSRNCSAHSPAWEMLAGFHLTMSGICRTLAMGGC